MRWRVFRWIVRIALVAAVLYGVWLVGSYFVGKHYFTEGMRRLADDPAAAARSFGTAVKLRPRNPQYRAALGRAYLKQGDYVPAADHLERAARRDPDNFGLWHDLGEACLHANSPARATEAFQRAREIRPDAQQPLAGLAEAAVLAGNWEAALDPLRTLWKQTPSDFETGARLVKALGKSGHYDETLKVCTTAKAQIARELADVDPMDQRWQIASPFLVAEGDAYRAKGRWAEAISAYLRCAAIKGHDEAALAGLRSVPEEIATAVVMEEGKACGPAFSPDSRKLAFYLFSSAANGVYVLETPGAEPRKVGPARSRPYAGVPVWSPDGSRICYSDEHDLRLINADGTGGRLLVKQAAALPQLQQLGLSDKRATTASRFSVQHSPAWSPGGKHIAYAASSPDDGSLTVVVDVASGKATSVHQTTGTLPKFAGEHPPHWSVDGRVICGPLAYMPPPRADGAESPMARCGLTVWSAAGEVKRQLSLAGFGGAVRAQGAGNRMDVLWAADTRCLAVALADEREAHPTVSVAVVESSGKWQRLIARNVAGSCSNPGSFARWLDPGHLWFVKRTGSTPVDAGAKAVVADLQGNVSPAKQSVPLPLFGEWDISRDRKWLALSAPGLAAKGAERGLWLFDLEELRNAEG